VTSSAWPQVFKQSPLSFLLVSDILVLSSTSLTAPLLNWPPVLPNIFAPDGGFGYPDSVVVSP
jgi:hypothetical protein